MESGSNLARLGAYPRLSSCAARTPTGCRLPTTPSFPAKEKPPPVPGGGRKPGRCHHAQVLLREEKQEAPLKCSGPEYHSSTEDVQPGSYHTQRDRKGSIHRRRFLTRPVP